MNDERLNETERPPRPDKKGSKVGFGLALAGGCFIAILGIIIILIGAALGTQGLMGLIEEGAGLPPEAYKDKTLIIEDVQKQFLIADKELEKVEITNCKYLTLYLEEYVDEIIVKESDNVIIHPVKGYGSKKILNSGKVVVERVPPLREIFGMFRSFLIPMGVFGLFFGGMVIVGAALGYKGKTTAGGVLAIVFSVFSLLSGGGFLIGFILGIVGGALILAGK